MSNKEKKQKGITLIALVITIVILIILATVTLNVVLGEGGLIQRAQDAKTLTEQATLQEQQELNSLMSEMANILAEELGPEPIPETESYVGYYADVDGDKQPDGVIYVDLADTENTSGRWNNRSDYEYTPVTEGLKQYEVCSESYTGFGSQWTMPVLTAVKGSTGADRFYVMALEDFNAGTYYCWYDAAYEGTDGKGMSDYATATSLDFGTGKANTEAMIAKWNSSAYGAQNDNGTYLDMWGAIQDKVEEGWFVPSRGEWGAFGDNLGITADNYVDYGLSDWCWSSSQYDANLAWTAYFYGGYMGNYTVDLSRYVRLSATF